MTPSLKKVRDGQTDRGAFSNVYATFWRLQVIPWDVFNTKKRQRLSEILCYLSVEIARFKSILASKLNVWWYKKGTESGAVLTPLPCRAVLFSGRHRSRGGASRFTTDNSICNPVCMRPLSYFQRRAVIQRITNRVDGLMSNYDEYLCSTPPYGHFLTYCEPNDCWALFVVVAHRFA